MLYKLTYFLTLMFQANRGI